MFSDMTLKVLDEPNLFQVMNEVQWKGSIHFFDGKFHETGFMVLTVPAGYVTDLASIPIGLRSIFSRLGRSRKPAVFHDYMYSTRYRTRKQCDQLFRIMLLERGVSRFKAWLYYMGVRAGGWTRGSW